MRDSKNRIRNGLTEWDEEIERLNDEERHQEKLEAFLQYRLNGNVQTMRLDAGSVDELVEDATLRILDIERKIRRIADFVPAAPNPAAAPVLPPVGAVGQDPVVLQQPEADGDTDSNPADEAEPIPAVDFDGDLPVQFQH